MWPNPQYTADLSAFTEEVLIGKLHFLCSASVSFFRAAILIFRFTDSLYIITF